jgi:peptide deformylase
MHIRISELNPETKTPQIILFNKIKTKSLAWNVSKATNVSEARALLEKMVKACLGDDGVGLAAPQINIFKQLFIIREMDTDNKPLESFIGYFNPEWKAVSEDGKETGIEGCLSVPGLPFEVSRWKTIDATWWELQEDGSFVERKETLTGYMARVFQHEHAHIRARSIVDDGKPAGEEDKLIVEDKKKQKLINTGANLKNKAVKVSGGASGARPKYS